MCKIFRYWFTCNHCFHLRRSQCGGTKHKYTRNGTSAACRSDPYLSIVLPVACGPCQQSVFEGAWKWKLSAAHLFLDKLKENRFPGISEVSALVEELQDECNMASWNTRLQFPHVHKARVTRVQLGQFTQQSSPLREEVAPEDISDQREVADHAHPDYKYDFDYVVSELEQVGDREGFIAGEERDGWAGCEGRGWEGGGGWGGGEESQKVQLQCESVPDRTHSAADMHQEERAKRVKMVIQEFWSVVNIIKDCKETPRRAMSTLKEDARNPADSLPALNPTETRAAPPTPPPTPPHPSTGRTCDSSHSKAPSLSSETPSQNAFDVANLKAELPQDEPPVTKHPAPSPSHTYYDGWRQHIDKMNNDKRKKFYREWLCHSRREIKAMEGSGGRFVHEPRDPRDRDAKNGWWK